MAVLGPKLPGEQHKPGHALISVRALVLFGPRGELGQENHCCPIPMGREAQAVPPAYT